MAASINTLINIYIEDAAHRVVFVNTSEVIYERALWIVCWWQIFGCLTLYDGRPHWLNS